MLSRYKLRLARDGEQVYGGLQKRWRGQVRGTTFNSMGWGGRVVSLLVRPALLYFIIIFFKHKISYFLIHFTSDFAGHPGLIKGRPEIKRLY